MARELVPAMVERGSGHLVFVSSISGKAPTARASLYAATKFGLRGFALCLREDLRPTGVGVSLVSPGSIRDAGMFADSGAAAPADRAPATPEQVGAAVVSAIERNRGEITVAPLRQRALALRRTTCPSSRAGSPAARAAKVADEIAAGQTDEALSWSSRARRSSSPAPPAVSAARSPPRSPAGARAVVLSSRKPEELEALAAELPGDGHRYDRRRPRRAGRRRAARRRRRGDRRLVANAGGRRPRTDRRAPGRGDRAGHPRQPRGPGADDPRPSRRRCASAARATSSSSPRSPARPPHRRHILYAATKSGLRAFALGLRQDLARAGVGVSVVTPGFIREAGHVRRVRREAADEPRHLLARGGRRRGRRGDREGQGRGSTSPRCASASSPTSPMRFPQRRPRASPAASTDPAESAAEAER